MFAVPRSTLLALYTTHAPYRMKRAPLFTKSFVSTAGGNQMHFSRYAVSCRTGTAMSLESPGSVPTGGAPRDGSDSHVSCVVRCHVYCRIVLRLSDGRHVCDASVIQPGARWWSKVTMIEPSMKIKLMLEYVKFTRSDMARIAPRYRSAHFSLVAYSGWSGGSVTLGTLDMFWMAIRSFSPRAMKPRTSCATVELIATDRRSPVSRTALTETLYVIASVMAATMRTVIDVISAMISRRDTAIVRNVLGGNGLCAQENRRSSEPRWRN
mmetsp:Transcript_22397/g.69484  ORF Transcript_22397/g.69484 Transcript_22397/m.69484 type:complete len:267 (+) Transcript_22397:401-1201(+)